MTTYRQKDPAAAPTPVIDTGATLANGARASGDFDNSTGGSGSGHFSAIAYLTVQYDSGPPSAGDSIADLYVLPGDGDDPDSYPNGGDGTLGNNVDPQQHFYVGSFEARQPSLTVDEVLALNVPLYPSGNRFVLSNTSGQTYDATWQLTIALQTTEDEL